MLSKRFLVSVLCYFINIPISIAGIAAVDFTLGAKLYVERCQLCHGPQAMGEGILAVGIKDYPSTTLLGDIKHRSVEELIHATKKGGSKGKMSKLMPPFEEELSEDQILALASFLVYLRKNTDKGLKLLAAEREKIPPSLKRGKQLFRTYCSICHGKKGYGDGQLANDIIKNPAPADFRKHKRDDTYLFEIISKGGEGAGRSFQMPAWADQLSSNEIKSLILFINLIYTNAHKGSITNQQ